MPDHRTIYNQDALNIEKLVSREDWQENLLKAVQEVCPLEGLMWWKAEQALGT